MTGWFGCPVGGFGMGISQLRYHHTIQSLVVAARPQSAS
jgi:hypothetical protein